MRRIGRLATLLLIVALPAAALADDIEVSATVNRTKVSLNGELTLTITVGGTMRGVPDPKLPELAAFNVYSSGTSSNFSMVNGRMSASKSWSFVLQPRRVGTFTIGSAEVEFDGAVYRTDPIDVEVVEGEPPEASGELEERRSSGVASQGRDVFITTSVDKKRAYVDEQITLSFKLYRRVQLWEQPRYSAPDLTGFWVEDLPPQEEYYETVDGIRYSVIEIKTALFGAAAGPATIGEATLTYRDRADPFTFFARAGKRRVLTTDPITVEILPLQTAGRPADFGGAVGSYRVRGSLDVTSVEALQPATLKITISGAGNIRTVPAPVIAELADFKVYESGTSTSVTKKDRRVGGSKSYEYVLVPQTPGKKTIPATSLSFFDPASGTYKVSETGEFDLDVAPAMGVGVGEGSAIPTRISRLGRDIRYIREPEGRLRPESRPVHARPLFVILQLLPAAAVAGTWVSKRRRDRLAGDVGLARFIQAPGRAKRELAAARASLSEGDRTAACAGIARAVTGFIGDRLNVSAGGMTLAELEAVLRSAGAGDDVIARVRSLLGACDLGRFAGASDEVEGGRLLAEAGELLDALSKLPVKGRR